MRAIGAVPGPLPSSALCPLPDSHQKALSLPRISQIPCPLLPVPALCASCPPCLLPSLPLLSPSPSSASHPPFPCLPIALLPLLPAGLLWGEWPGVVKVSAASAIPELDSFWTPGSRGTGTRTASEEEPTVSQLTSLQYPLSQGAVGEWQARGAVVSLLGLTEVAWDAAAHSVLPAGALPPGH